MLGRLLFAREVGGTGFTLPLVVVGLCMAELTGAKNVGWRCLVWNMDVLEKRRICLFIRWNSTFSEPATVFVVAAAKWAYP